MRRARIWTFGSQCGGSSPDVILVRSCLLVETISAPGNLKLSAHSIWSDTPLLTSR